MKKQKGFTLIELLVVIAIIGLLSTLAVVSLNNARQKSRDAKRVADIKQIQTALELYFNDHQGYPASVTSGSNISTTATSVTSTGITYMALVPTNPGPGGSTYTYSGSSNTYTLTYTLEAATGGLTSGAHTATPAGL